MIIVFLILVGLILYTYFGYPILLGLLAKWFGKKVRKDEIYPRVSIIITAYNEEKDISKKIKNTLALNYPEDRYDVIIASDASTDRTEEIIDSFKGQGVILLKMCVRLGKTAAQNEAVKIAKGEIVVFSDATTMYHRDILKNIVRNFADTEVGGVGAELIYINKNNTSVGDGTGLYWKYEKYLRNNESALTSLIGFSGCCYALRKELYENINPDLISDFIIAQQIYKKGKRVVFEPGALVFEETNTAINEEFKMRVRVAVRSLFGLWYMRKLLNPFKYRMYAIQLISHKVLRYLVPLFLILLFFINLIIYNKELILKITFLLQSLFYLSAIIGLLKRNKKTIFNIPTFFCVINFAALIAIFKFLNGEKKTIWETQRRSYNRKI